VGLGMILSTSADVEARFTVENAGFYEFDSVSGSSSYLNTGPGGFDFTTGTAGGVASLTMAVNPLGDCAVVVYEPVFGTFNHLTAFPAATLSVPPVSLVPGTNKIPITSTASCS
jgi:hypothetical protein